MLKEKLNEFSRLFVSLKNKLARLQQNFTHQLHQKDTALTAKTNQFNELSRKLELSAKEQSENEKILDVLLKEMRELEESL
jgi:hypothetical protein